MQHSDDENSADAEKQLEDEEQGVLYSALESFRHYRRDAHYNITHLRRQAFYSLPSAHNDILCDPPFDLPSTFHRVDDAIDANAYIADMIVEAAQSSFGINEDSVRRLDRASSADIDKARSTIRQLYREWSAEGAPERKACFDPMIRALEEYLPASYEERANNRVLVPGAGLGRLVLEVCLAGYTVEGNEISYHQLFAANYMLNFTPTAEHITLYPWALGFSNHHKRDDQFRSVAIPDVHAGTALSLKQADYPTSVPAGERMSMSAGDFCVIYRSVDHQNCFDAVMTCFFVDTAPNLIKYVETVRHCLKPNGIWINLGPLLWHFEAAPTPATRHEDQSNGQASGNDVDCGIGEPGSFELANDEVLLLLEKLGFRTEIHQEMPGGASGYIQDPLSMLQNVYKPVFWVARKV